MNDQTNYNRRVAYLDNVLSAVRAEALRAITKHEPMHSPHEGISVIREELDVELWEHVCRWAVVAKSQFWWNGIPAQPPRPWEHDWKVTPWWLRKLFGMPMFRYRGAGLHFDKWVTRQPGKWVYSDWPGPENTEPEKYA